MLKMNSVSGCRAEKRASRSSARPNVSKRKKQTEEQQRMRAAHA
jgi:hypothetical protein